MRSGAIDSFQKRQQIRPLCRGQLRLNRSRRRKPRPTRSQPMQREHLLESLGLPSMQVRRVIVDSEQRWYVEPILPERRARGSVIADLDRIFDIEGPHILDIFDGAIVARE